MPDDSVASFDGFVFNTKKEWKTLDESVREELREVFPGLGPLLGSCFKQELNKLHLMFRRNYVPSGV